MIQCSSCGKVYNTNQTPLYCRCGGRTGEPTETVVSNAWVSLVRLLQQPQDKGVGDTVARIAAKFGGERFKAFAEKVGIPCGCSDRQAEWNRLFPYER